MIDNRPLHGYADIAAVGALLADATRARVLAALADGRALPASVLAAEAGVAASTASEHLARLVDGGLLTVERSGRHRYFRLANPQVGAAIEALAVLAPTRPVRSLQESTRAAAMRRARSCYDHLAGQLGVAVTEALLEHRALVRTDGVAGNQRAQVDRLSAPVAEHPYELGPDAERTFARLGVDLETVRRQRRPLLRFCVDWSEQRHHLSGALGAALLTRMESAGWLRRHGGRRSLRLTDTGARALDRVLGLDTAAWLGPGGDRGRVDYRR
ncbi:metalloregulator ArsR/SmtB family transcription factor [Nocardia sp. CDC159]|uniref:Metalloregulator ArsR/SmtB family transcription factor n=1 Tax=Nocardia pulmonis TaxID=2951408 RepID=A0A9X2E676_9NOCA|nr:MULTISPECIES: metalloregulator ArsR/SmtB family transcription factor [Nocardia]MCM6774396.1 metalloregulator ArsR/SmtB family transcription factor [Nocardia pulmonis]MCM6787538.1 metalloregulator ArsR/SmtB family transcription factor [Nocardia sp. CDC159]